MNAKNAEIQALQQRIDLLTIKAQEADAKQSEIEDYQKTLAKLFEAGLIDARGLPLHPQK